MKEYVLKILEWLHITMVFAMIIPLFCIGSEYGYDLFFRCYFIIIPVSVSEIAARKCKHMTVYLFFSLSSVMLLFQLAQRLQPVLNGEWYVVLITLEGLIIVIIRMVVRIKMESERPLYPDASVRILRRDLLNHPSVFVLGYFGAVYIAGIGAPNMVLCDATFLSTLLYIFLLVIYTFLKQTKEYLVINRDVHRLPLRRIYTVGGCVVVFLLLIILLSAFFALTVRPLQWPSNNVKVPVEIVQEEEEEESERERPERDGLGESGWKVIEPESQSDNGILILIGLVMLGGVIVLVIRAILSLFSDFRRSYDENGDQIELLVDEEPTALHSIIIREVKEPEIGSIRRKYRRMIRKNRKDMPDVWESPSEMEEKAGLAEDADMQQLHVEYEAARYGK